MFLISRLLYFLYFIKGKDLKNYYYFQTAAEETSFEENLKKNNNGPIQPRCYIIGELENCKGCVITTTTKYMFNNPIEAIDACFKIFQGLNTEYPRESEHIWEFLQKAIYNITTSSDKNYNSVLLLMDELKKIIL